MQNNMESLVNCKHLLQKASTPPSPPPPPPPPPPPVSQHTPFVELSAVIQSKIDAALAKYSADCNAKFDFTLENVGGRVVDSSPTYNPSEIQFKIFGFTLSLSFTNSYPNIITQVRN